MSFLTSDTNAPTGVVAIVSAGREARPDEALHALVRGGVRYVEVTPVDALATVRRWSDIGGVDVVVGMLARTADGVRAAVDAGARFLHAPSLSTEVFECAAAAGVPVVCGAITPAQVRDAHRAGAASVRISNPPDALEYARLLRGALPEVPLLPAGLIGPDAARRFRSLGCFGVATSGLFGFRPDRMSEARWAEVETDARALTQAWEAAG